MRHVLQPTLKLTPQQVRDAGPAAVAGSVAAALRRRRWRRERAILTAERADPRLRARAAFRSGIGFRLDHFSVLGTLTPAVPASAASWRWSFRRSVSRSPRPECRVHSGMGAGEG